MPTCPHCDAEVATEDLVRHERPGVIRVHCPHCERPLGRYRRHGDDPRTDALRD